MKRSAFATPATFDRQPYRVPYVSLGGQWRDDLIKLMQLFVPMPTRIEGQGIAWLPT